MSLFSLEVPHVPLLGGHKSDSTSAASTGGVVADASKTIFDESPNTKKFNEGLPEMLANNKAVT